MRAFHIVVRQLTQQQPKLTKTLARVLVQSLTAANHARALTVTELGRALPRRGSLKYKVKALARFLASDTLQQQMLLIAAAFASLLLDNVERPMLLVDWTEHNDRWLLYCAVAHDGRALPIYFEVYDGPRAVCPRNERAFLQRLKAHVLPKGCVPVLVSDAGFRTEWFEAVIRLGMHYIGRLVPNVQLQHVDAAAEVWMEAGTLGSAARDHAEDLGRYRVRKTGPLEQRLVRYRGEPTRMPSQERARCARQGKAAEQHRRMARAGWMLATSLSSEEADAARIVSGYALRMQVEELFRSLKSGVYGQGARDSQSRDMAVLSSLWLVGSGYVLVAHLVGMVAEEQGWHRDYQTNTVRDRRVLSLVMLGSLVLSHHDQRQITEKRINAALCRIRASAQLCSLPVPSTSTSPSILKNADDPKSMAAAA